MTTPLSPTPRTALGRSTDRARTDRGELHALLRDALVAHVGVIIDAMPVVLPTAFAFDPDGPDPEGTLYLHGSVAARWLGELQGMNACVTVTELDGLVIGRSGFHHSMNYRSAVIMGAVRLVNTETERGTALDLIVDHIIPGRSGTLRRSTRKELAATVVLALPLAEASLKARTGGPRDDPEDIAAGVWGGEIALRRTALAPLGDADVIDGPPEDVLDRVRGLND